MEQIELFLKTQIGLTRDDLRQKVMEAAYIRSVKKGEYLIKCGENPIGLCFLIDGLLRGFFIDYQGNDVTDCFGFQFGSTAMPYADFNAPSPINIFAMEDSRIMVIPIQLIRQMLFSFADCGCCNSQRRQAAEFVRIRFAYTDKPAKIPIN